MSRPRAKPDLPVKAATPGPARAPAVVPGPGATTGQRWRFRRNLVIYLASKNGASQRLLADVFDLPHSRVCAILKQFRALAGDS